MTRLVKAIAAGADLLMLGSPLRVIRSYWHYFLWPPLDDETRRQVLRRGAGVFAGLGWTSLALGAALRCPR